RGRFLILRHRPVADQLHYLLVRQPKRGADCSAASTLRTMAALDKALVHLDGSLFELIGEHNLWLNQILEDVCNQLSLEPEPIGDLRVKLARRHLGAR